MMPSGPNTETSPSDSPSNIRDNRPASLAEAAYLRIRSAVLSGEFAPGQLLAEQQLANAIGMSRTPVRRGLEFLAADGLLRMIPGRGAIVVELTPRHLIEIFELREALEVYALREAHDRLDRDRLAALRTIFTTAVDLVPTSGAPPSVLSSVLSAADEAFHGSFIAALSNSLIAESFNRLRLRLLDIRLRSWAATPAEQRHRGLTVGAREHCEIIDAILSGRLEQAERALSAHLRGGREHMLAVIGQPPAQRLRTLPETGTRIVTDILDRAHRTSAEITSVLKESIIASDARVGANTSD